MSAPRWLAPLALASLAGCASLESSPAMPPPLARTRATADFGSYPLRRVGLVPFIGEDADPIRLRELQQAFGFELARNAPFELVQLSATDLEEVALSHAHERGTYAPATIVTAARRFRLDGLLVGTVTHLQTYAPQSLGVKLELVPVETGLPIWVADLDIDSAEAVVRRSIDAYQAGRRDSGGGADDAQLVLLSPASFMRFAAGEVARTFEPR